MLRKFKICALLNVPEATALVGTGEKAEAEADGSMVLSSFGCFSETVVVGMGLNRSGTWERKGLREKNEVPVESVLEEDAEGSIILNPLGFSRGNVVLETEEDPQSIRKEMREEERAMNLWMG